jgi:hypothetical protein
MMSIRDLEELDDSLQAMGVSNMDALQRAKALLNTAASKKKKANYEHGEEEGDEEEEEDPLETNDINSEFHHFGNNNHVGVLHNNNNDLYNHEEDTKDHDQRGRHHGDIHSSREENNHCESSTAMVEEKFNGMFVCNSPHAIQDLRFHSPMEDIWDRRPDDLSSPSVSLATISEDGEHGDDDEEDESFDPHDRFFIHEPMMRSMSLEDDINNIHMKDDIINNSTNNEVVEDDDISIDSIDNDALVQRFKLLENTKISLLSQCSYLESKLERKTSKLIRVEEQKKELQLRLDRIEAENRDDMKDVMRKMNQMEISYQQRIAIQDARIQQLEMELMDFKREKITSGSETSKESNSSSSSERQKNTSTTEGNSSTSTKHKRNWFMYLK